MRKLDDRYPFKSRIRDDLLHKKIISLYEGIVLQRGVLRHSGRWGEEVTKLNLERLPQLTFESRSAWATAMIDYFRAGLKCSVFKTNAEKEWVSQVCEPA